MKEYTVNEARDIICRYFVMRGAEEDNAKELRCVGCHCTGCAFNAKMTCTYCLFDNEFLSNAEEELNKADCECEVDWSKVKVDTKILVRNNEQEDWDKRYFAKYENERVCSWVCWGTSWSAPDKTVLGWKYAKLAEEEEND